MQDHFAASVHYSTADYQKLRETYRLWWQGRLQRPIVPIVTTDHRSHRAESPYPLLCSATAWDPSLSPQQIIDALDYRFSTLRFHGDAYPWVNFDAFGPGVLAAFLGCRPNARRETVWFEPPRLDIPLEELHFSPDENNPCLHRVLNVYEAGMEQWRGAVVLGMADLGGILDVLANFRGTENLLMDLLDNPQEVQRCIEELQECWFFYYQKILSVIGKEAMGYTQWFNLYGEQPGYILQSDFSYMISPEMFEMFVAPELASSAARLHNAIYHLDGVGEIPHLDRILQIEGIRGIQWVPGAGEPETRDWSELVGRILAGGKKLLSCNTKHDGTPIDQADPGALFLGERHFADIASAQRYAALFGMKL